MATHSSTLAWKIRGQRSLVGCSPWGREESDTTERLHFHFSLSCIGEGNGNPLQCSCLENPRDRGAWWAAVCGVAQSWTRLKWLSSSSSSSIKRVNHVWARIDRQVVSFYRKALICADASMCIKYWTGALTCLQWMQANVSNIFTWIKFSL